MIQTNNFVIDSLEKKLRYGVDVYQVWECAKHARDNDELGQTLKYETSSKAKANAVCEYLNIKAELEAVINDSVNRKGGRLLIVKAGLKLTGTI